MIDWSIEEALCWYEKYELIVDIAWHRYSGPISWHLHVGGSRDCSFLSRPLKFSLERLSVSILSNGLKYSRLWNVARNNCGIEMSRAHMLYDNKPLESIPVTPVRWEKRWEPEMHFRSQRLVGFLYFLEWHIVAFSFHHLSPRSTNSWLCQWIWNPCKEHKLGCTTVCC